MIIKDKITEFEAFSSARNNPGRELEYFVWLLWKGAPAEVRKYVNELERKGFASYVLTLTAAESYFPFAYDGKEQPIRAKRMAGAFSNGPFYWKDSFCQEDKFKSKGRK